MSAKAASLSQDNHRSAVPPLEQIHPDRVALLSAAVELQVDVDDAGLRSEAEHRLWRILTEEYEALVARIGPVWVADGADQV